MTARVELLIYWRVNYKPLNIESEDIANNLKFGVVQQIPSSRSKLGLGGLLTTTGDTGGQRGYTKTWLCLRLFLVFSMGTAP